MLTFLGIMTAAGGLFLFLWYRTVAGLSIKQQPPFMRPALFKWGVPVISLLVFASGLLLMAAVNPILAAGAAAGSGLLAFLIIRFDRYSANMRLIYDRYCRVRRASAEMEEIEVLFQTAAWRYPKWSHDRLVELVAGKTIEDLILLMILSEHEINPIADWELYRTLKDKAARIVQKAP